VLFCLRPATQFHASQNEALASRQPEGDGFPHSRVSVRLIEKSNAPGFEIPERFFLMSIEGMGEEQERAPDNLATEQAIMGQP
jgi:hypothetical protein